MRSFSPRRRLPRRAIRSESEDIGMIVGNGNGLCVRVWIRVVPDQLSVRITRNVPHIALHLRRLSIHP